MALTNGMECQHFKWILTQYVRTGIVIVVVVIAIAIDIQDYTIKEWENEA